MSEKQANVRRKVRLAPQLRLVRRALLSLHRHVLDIRLPSLDEVVPEKKVQCLPAVLMERQVGKEESDAERCIGRICVVGAAMFVPKSVV